MGGNRRGPPRPHRGLPPPPPEHSQMPYSMPFDPDMAFNAMPPRPLSHDEQHDQDDLTEAVEKGKRCENRDVYRVPHEDNPDKYRWVDEKPMIYGLTGDKTKTKKAREAFAVNVYHVFNEDIEEWFVLKVCVNSELLHTVLEKVLEGYPGLTQHELKSFSPPFHPFVHRWQDLLKYSNDLDTTSETWEHLRLLRGVMEPLLEDSFGKVNEASKTGHIAFNDLPLLYIPGTTALRHDTNTAGIFRSCRIGRPINKKAFAEITVDVVDWDGRRCGLLSQQWIVYEYYGLRALTAIDVSPLNGLPDEQKISEGLVERGRVFEKLRGQSFLAFTDEHEERANERMVVDARAYYKFETRFPEYNGLDEIGQLTWAQAMNRFSTSMHSNLNYGPPPPIPSPSDHVSHVKFDLSPMTDEQCRLAVSTVKCFNIAKKRWENLNLAQLHEIPWAEHAFDRLVLDQSEKDLVLALVDRDHFKGGKPFKDLVGGKGEGMTMLLCGPPGVGKTLTAETVSEHLRRPLYKLGAGDLGIDASQVENCLEKALNLCGHFGAVLLIDEADVFMESRTSNNLERNELVSVFLRLLEYYNGIMILTTNRMGSIDTAFESRIDITLTYNSLTEADRKQVWRNFLATLDATDVDISEEDLIKLAGWVFNGRQIKSAIKTARILASKQQERLSVNHLMIVLNLRSKALGLLGRDVKGT